MRPFRNSESKNSELSRSLKLTSCTSFSHLAFRCSFNGLRPFEDFDKNSTSDFEFRNSF